MEQLTTCISYWKNALAEHRFALSPSVEVIIESTITYLQALLAGQAVKK